MAKDKDENDEEGQAAEARPAKKARRQEAAEEAEPSPAMAMLNAMTQEEILELSTLSMGQLMVDYGICKQDAQEVYDAVQDAAVLLNAPDTLDTQMTGW